MEVSAATSAQLARDALADIQLIAQLRSAFQEAQVVMGQTLAELNLTEQRYHLLVAVAAGDRGGTGQSVLARELHCPEPRISLLVHELSIAGQVETLRADDRRHVLVRLTASGEAMLGQAITVQREALHSLVSTLEVSEVTRLAELVARTYLGLDLSVAMRTPRSGPPPPARTSAVQCPPATIPAPTATARAVPGPG